MQNQHFHEAFFAIAFALFTYLLFMFFDYIEYKTTDDVINDIKARFITLNDKNTITIGNKRVNKYLGYVLVPVAILISLVLFL